MWLLSLESDGWSLMSIWNLMVFFFHLIQVSWICPANSFCGDMLSLIVKGQKRHKNMDENIDFFVHVFWGVKFLLATSRSWCKHWRHVCYTLLWFFSCEVFTLLLYLYFHLLLANTFTCWSECLTCVGVKLSVLTRSNTWFQAILLEAYWFSYDF